MSQSKQDNSAVKKITDLLFKSDAENVSAATEPSVGDGSASARADGDVSGVVQGAGQSPSEAFERRLADVLTANGRALSGRVHVVNLAKLRAHFGEKWPNICQYVEQLVARVIERNISEGDFFTRGEDFTFFLVMPSLPKRSAQLVCALIAQEVFETLLDMLPEESEVDIRTLVMTLDGRIDFERGRHLEALAALFAERVAGGDPEISQRLQVVSEKALLAEEARKQAAAKPATDKAALHSDWAKRAAAAKAEALNKVDLPGPRIDLPEGSQVIYKPIWNVKNRVITNYLVDVAWSHSDGRLVTKELRVGEPGRAPPVERLDLAVLQRAAEILSAVQKKGRQSVLTVPVSVDSVIKSELWTPYQRTCRAIPEPLRKLVVFEIVGLTAATAQVVLETVVGALRPFCRAVLVRVPLETTSFSSLTNAHVHAVGVGLDAYSLPENEIIAKFDRFVEKASGCGLHTYVHGLSSLSLTTAAVCSGFDYIDGNAIRSPVDGPDGVFPLDLEMLYKGLLKK